MIHIDFTLRYIELYLIIINFFAFALYSFDKLQAIRLDKNISRVPELRLLFFTFIGGTVGSILAMIFFRHKIKKFSFLWKFIVVIILQIILIAICNEMNCILEY